MSLSFEDFPYSTFQEHYQPQINLEESTEMDQNIAMEKLSQQVDILQKELSDKEQELTKTNKEHKKLKTLYKTCEEKRKKLSSQLDLAMVQFDELTADFEEQIHEKKDPFSPKEFEELKSKLEHKIRQLEKLTEKNKTLQREKKTLEEKTMTLENTTGEMSDVFSQYKVQKSAVADVLRQKELEIENLNLQLDRIKYENEDLRKIMEQNQKSLAENELTTGELENDLGAHQQNLSELTQKLITLQEKNEKLKFELGEKTSVFKQTHGDGEWMKNQIQEKTAYIEKLEEKIRQLERTWHTSDISKQALGKNNMDLKFHLQHLEDDKEELLTQLRQQQQKSITNQSDKIKINDKFERLETENRQLEEKINLIENLNRKLEEDLKTKDHDLINCADIIEEKKLEIIRYCKTIQEWRSKEQEFQKLQSEFLTLQMEHRNLKRDLERTQHQLQNATKRFGMKDETSEKLRLENDALNNANIKFNETMFHISNQVDSLTADRNHFRKLYKESQTEIDTAQRQVERSNLAQIDAETKYKNLMTKLDSLEKEITHNESLARDRLLSINKHIDRIKRVEEEKQRLVRELNLVLEEKKQFLDRSTILETELRNCEDKKHEMAVKLEQIRGSHSEQGCAIQEKESKFLKLESVCKAQEQEIDGSKNLITQLQQQHELHKREIRDLSIHRNDLDSKLREMTNKASKYQTSLKDELDRREILQDEHNRTQGEIRNAKNQLVISNQKEKELQDILLERNQVLGKLNEEIQRRDQSKQTLENAHRELSRKFTELTENIKHLQTLYREKEDECSMQVNEILALRTRLEAYAEDNGKLTIQAEQRTKTLHKAANDVRGLKSDRAVLRNQLVRKGDELSKITHVVTVRANENEKLKIKMKDIQKTYQDLYQNYNLMKKKHQEATNECVQYRFQLERAGQKLKNAYGVQISFDKKMKDMNLRLQSKSEALEQSTQRFKQILTKESATRSELQFMKEQLLGKQAVEI